MTTMHRPRFAGHAGRRSRFSSTIIAVGLAVMLCGCSLVRVYTAANHDRSADLRPVQPTRATMTIREPDLAQGVFVGIAMSGGGARAANFSAAALLELESLGFLQHASAISAVSGSALSAAYYGVYGRTDQSPAERSEHWGDAPVRDRFLVDFQTHWLLSWFNPWNIIRYWFTDFDRSDIMKKVFETHLFAGRRPPRFADMGTGRPMILINATSLPQSGPFLFTDEAFEELGSRLDTYPLSHAIMASGAFPGAFHNVTLKDFRRPGYYQHLFDGGPADNLGVHTLVAMINAVRPPNGCFVFIVDAFPYNTGKGENRPDTRGVLDFFVDQNVSDSADVFLTLRRYDTLHRWLGYPRAKPGQTAQWDFTTDHGVVCRAWHLTFQSLLERDVTRTARSEPTQRELGKELEREKDVNLIPTRYRLEGPRRLRDREVQDMLFRVAHHLIHEDGELLNGTCEWFRSRGLQACPAASGATR